MAAVSAYISRGLSEGITGASGSQNVVFGTSAPGSGDVEIRFGSTALGAGLTLREAKELVEIIWREFENSNVQSPASPEWPNI